MRAARLRTSRVPKPGNANPCALFQMFANARNRFGENFVRLLLRNAVCFGDFRR